VNEESASRSTLADVTQMFSELTRGMNEVAHSLRISLGITPESERPYLGKRCGWYPEKPKRKATGGRTIQARRLTTQRRGV
jgi:hypothetical protein